MNIKFGTDGWRAVIAEDFNFANVARVAQAAADYWKSEIRNPKSEIYGRQSVVVVGYDRRFFSERFAQTTAEVLAGNGSGSSAFSSPVSATTPSGVATGLSATAAGSQSTSVSWNTVSGVTGYILDRSMSPSGVRNRQVMAGAPSTVLLTVSAWISGR